jgi:hypothetical protein
MAIVKRRNERTEARLLLESDDPVELPPAEIEEGSVVVQFDSLKPFVPELLEALRAGTLAEPVPVMLDGSTFVVHGATRSFWVKLWHAAGDLARVERAQVISCLPSTRGVQIVVAGMDEEFDDDEDEDYDDDELGDDDDEDEDDEDEGDDSEFSDAEDEKDSAPGRE